MRSVGFPSEVDIAARKKGGNHYLYSTIPLQVVRHSDRLHRTTSLFRHRSACLDRLIAPKQLEDHHVMTSFSNEDEVDFSLLATKVRGAVTIAWNDFFFLLIEMRQATVRRKIYLCLFPATD